MKRKLTGTLPAPHGSTAPTSSVIFSRVHPAVLLGALLSQPVGAAAEPHVDRLVAHGLAELHDPTGRLDFETVSSSVGDARFEALPGPVPHRRRLDGHLWVRFDLHNPTPRPVLRYVHVDWLRLEEVTFFARTQQGLRQSRSGAHVPFSARPVWGRDIAFSTDLAPGERQVVYLRVRTRAEVRVPIRVLSARAHHRAATFGALGTGAFAGTLLSLSVFAVVVFLRLRHRMYLFFALHMAAFLAWWLCARGWGSALDAEPGTTVWLLAVFLDLWLFARLAFTRALLDLDTVAPRLGRVLFAAQAFGVPLLFAAKVAAPRYAPLTGILAPILLLGLELYSGFVAPRRGHRLARGYLVATGGLFTGLLITFLVFAGLPLDLSVARFTIRLGVLGELLGLALVLAESIREVSRQRAQAVAQVESERQRGRERLRAIEQVRLREREQMARDLHDSVAHHVSGIAIRAQSGLAVASSEASGQTHALRAISDEASRALSEMRTIVGSLRRDGAPSSPGGLADLGQLARTDHPDRPVALQVIGDGRDVSIGVSRAVYRIVQESVTNARRHAVGATRIDVRVSIDATQVRFEIVDDGPVTGEPTSAGYGLLGMRERAHLLGGELEAGPLMQGGWRVGGHLPRRLGAESDRSVPS